VPKNLFDAYVSGQAQAFFARSPTSASDRKRAVELAWRPVSPVVLRCLQTQNARFGESAARTAQLAALAQGAAAVLTGQQVGLFLGPLYTLYKAASAIGVARALAAESGRPVVPVFWLQTEDHDLAEIASCTVVARTASEPLTLSIPSARDNRISVAHLKLPETIDEALASLESELGGLPHAREHLDRLARHYRAGAGWAAAFAGLLAELFEPEGLLLIDPRDPAIHRRALTQAPQLEAALRERSDALERAGFAAAVHLREGAPLSFFHPAGASGARYRLLSGDAGLREVGGLHTHSQASLLAALERDPLTCSTSALLRPIVQDTLLPTAAYVGGPGELSYFAQLAPLYAAFGLELPLFVPRARFAIIEAATARLLVRLQLEPAALQKSEDALLTQLDQQQAKAAGGLAPEALERRLAAGFEQLLAAAIAEMPDVVTQLEPQFKKTREKVHGSVAKLAEKYRGALLRRDQLRVQDVARLKLMLYPGGEPQERVYNLSYFAARYGERTLIEAVLAALEPFVAAAKELRL
jgi:bacillithiol synthase